MGQIEISRPRRVAIHGLPYFCAKLARLLRDRDWDIRYHFYQPTRLPRFAADLCRCDLAFTWGGRISMGKFLWAARGFRKKNVVILWCGSDVLQAQKELSGDKMDSWVAERTHWAASPILAEEVRALGLACEYVQVSFVEPISTPPPLPSKFSVLVYVPTIERASLYGLDQILEVAEALRCIEFTLVGLRESETLTGPPNLKVYGRLETIGPFIERSSVIWRPVRHDAGTSFMVLEALAQGRHVLYSYPFPSCIQATSAAAARAELERLFNLHESNALRSNEEGVRTIAAEFTPERVRTNFFERWAAIIDPGRGAQTTKSDFSQREISLASVNREKEKTCVQHPAHL